jgi:hypothetical protein
MPRDKDPGQTCQNNELNQTVEDCGARGAVEAVIEMNLVAATSLSNTASGRILIHSVVEATLE